MHETLAYEAFPVRFEPSSISVDLLLKFPYQTPHIHCVDQKSAVLLYQHDVSSDFHVIYTWGASKIGISFASTRYHFTLKFFDHHDPTATSCD